MMRRTPKYRIWRSLAAALLLHALVLSLPISRLEPPVISDTQYVEVEFSAFLRDPVKTPESEVEAISPTGIQTTPEVLPDLAELTLPRPATIIPTMPGPLSADIVEEQPRSIAQPARSASSDIILGRQFITEEAVIDQIFDKPLDWQHAKPRVEFHFPARQDLLTMLDRPMQDLPLAYTPGLVHFAYAPGVRGDLQRFWDVITPEFGWRTNNGTEVKCILLLVVVGCGWK